MMQAICLIIITSLVFPAIKCQLQCDRNSKNGDYGPDNVFADGLNTYTVIKGDEMGRKMTLDHEQFLANKQSQSVNDDLIRLSKKYALFSDASDLYAIYYTNGTATCKYDPSKAADCGQGKAKFTALHAHCQGGLVIQAISATQLSSHQFLFTIKTKDKVNAYHQLTVNYDGSAAAMLNGSTMLPTAMVSLSAVDSQSDKMLAYYGNVATVGTFDLTDPLALDLDISYVSSKDTYGCEPDVCFNSRILSIFGLPQGGVHYFYIVKGLHSLEVVISKVTRKGKEKDFIDNFESLPLKNRAVVVKGDACNVMKLSDKSLTPCDKHFPEYDKVTLVDAIFTLPATSQIFFVSGDRFFEYEEKPSGSFNFVETGPLADLWPGLPAKIDAATFGHNNVFFFVDNFVYTVKAADIRHDRKIDEPKLIQEVFHFFSICSDSEIAKDYGFINIKSQKDIISYRMNFNPSVIKPPKTRKTTTSTSTLTPETESTLSDTDNSTAAKPTSSTSATPMSSTTTIGAIIGTVLLVLLIIVCLIVFKCRSKTQPSAQSPVSVKFSKLADNEKKSGSGEEETDNKFHYDGKIKSKL
ncbi:hypothetical protein HDE_13243 [Halotydeus destructor]|nr:hypothetical protein HDE_13243 [Halotydeus destructor]